MIYWADLRLLKVHFTQSENGISSSIDCGAHKIIMKTTSEEYPPTKNDKVIYIIHGTLKSSIQNSTTGHVIVPSHFSLNLRSKLWTVSEDRIWTLNRESDRSCDIVSFLVFYIIGNKNYPRGISNRFTSGSPLSLHLGKENAVQRGINTLINLVDDTLGNSVKLKSPVGYAKLLFRVALFTKGKPMYPEITGAIHKHSHYQLKLKSEHKVGEVFD